MASATPRADEKTWLIQQQRMADGKLDGCVRSCGGAPDGWCQYVVADEQLEDYPKSTLCFARMCRLMLIFFITFCVLGLCTGWALEGSMTLMEEVNTKSEMPLPNIALCPQPWGSQFAGGKLSVESAQMIQLPGGKPGGQAEFMEESCPTSDGRLSGCTCINLGENIVKPHGKRGELTYFDYIEMKVSGENESPAHQWAFGFYSDGMVPQQWSYASEGHVVEGDVKMEEVATGKTEFSDGEAIPRYTFRVTGDGQSPDGTTTFVFGYDKYLSFVIASFESKFSFFAIMTLMITFCAAINNFGIFELAFPEKSETASLEPNVCFRMVCGACCICCHPVEERASRRASKEDLIESSRGGS